MDVLLLTTLPNRVAYQLNIEADMTLQVIDYKDDLFKDKISAYIISHFNFVLVTYRCPYIVPKEVYSKAKAGAFNIHPSLLPKYPGLNPWDEMFAVGEREGGVTIHKLSDNVDAGEIVLQKDFRIESYDTISTARVKADKIAAELISLLLKEK